MQEVKEAISKQKNNKTSREDAVISELLKNGGQSLIENICILINSTWEIKCMSAEWDVSLICLIFKKVTSFILLPCKILQSVFIRGH